jgi:starch-binding outer membrane protein, SusD/RagB family
MRFHRCKRLQSALGMLAAAAVFASGCSLQDIVGSEMPPTTIDPEILRTEEGAMAMYRGTLWAFRRGVGGANGSFILATGRMTDELTTGAYMIGGAPGVLAPASANELDARAMPEDGILRSAWVESWYRNLNMARNQASDGIYYLSNFAPFVPKDLIGHMHAVRGMTMIYLADAFCSGIPLTEYRSPGGMDYKPGSTTAEVYSRAIIQFDSAFMSLPDSVRLRHFASVGTARALLNLGKLAEAAAKVRDVPTSFQYKALYAQDTDGSFSNNWVWGIRDWSHPENEFGTVADREGGNGLPFVSANDPRVPLVRAPMQNSSFPNTTYWLPALMLPKTPPWNGLSSKPLKNAEDIVLSSGIEARLIEAEAAAAAGDATFVSILNTLRTTCASVEGCPTPAPAGTGGVAGLAPLTDPGTREARLRMVMNERGYWLFLTGHRQGDLRRMVRVHGFPQETVYPSGPFVHGGQYGNFTNIPIPGSEKRINTRYDGCFNRDA